MADASESLFPTPPPEPRSGAGLSLATVALENSLDRVLTYLVPRAFASTVAVGQRVKVPLGRSNKPARGYVVDIPTDTDVDPAKLKRLLAIEDERVLVTPNLMTLARWMSRYYVSPLGTVLETVIPAAVKKRVGLGYITRARLAVPRERLQELVETIKQPKRRSLYARLLQLGADEEIDLLKLASDAGVKVPTARKLVKAGVIVLRTTPDLSGMEEPTATPAVDAAVVTRELPLNDDQRAAYEALKPKLAGGFSTTLLLGVTGSGKTEVYLHAIRDVLAAGKRAIVLVPEIALTPQTVRRFLDRFPAPRHVAYLHSGLTATARHRQWQTILAGKADVVVGARSAIFAPLPDVGIIVVDEEHESSYKQDTAPRYHARDLAIKRGQLEGCPVLLGSATPSLESYVRATEAGNEAMRHSGGGTPPTGNKGETGSQPSEPSLPQCLIASLPSSPLLLLPRRVRGLPMPHVELVDMKQELRQTRQQHLISKRLEYLLRTTLDQGRQAILLLNRRGYSNFVFCSSCQEAIECKYCDATLTYHRNLGSREGTGVSDSGRPSQPATRNSQHSPPAFVGASHKASLHTGQLHCHYCLAVNALPEKCPTCGKLLSLFGLGTQRIEEELLKKFPDLAEAYARVDSDTMRSGRDYERLLERFGKGEVKVMLGTQMIAKGLDYPNVTLVGVISGDTALALPDFRAAERTFQLITQVSGRAGRGDAPGRVVLQTFLPDDPTIQSALKQDYAGFAARELAQRREIPLPPYARLARIILRDTDEEKVQKAAADLAAGLTKAAEDVGAIPNHLTIKGPMPCAITRIAGYHRVAIVLTARTPAPIQRTLAKAREAGLLKNPDRLAIDIDPVSLL